MDSGFYAACTALVSRTQALDTIANNLANASTVGYRNSTIYSAPCWKRPVARRAALL
jgi:flagellar basal body rod protein FlgG